MVDIEQWLQGLGLERYAKAFRESDIIAAVLEDLTDQDLKELGVSLGHRRLILKAIQALPENRGAKSASETSRPAPSQTLGTRSDPERRQLTVLFCDLSGSTEMSAQFDPEDVQVTIRNFQDCCAEVIGRFDGYVAKFMGDGTLAYFGYPRAHEDEAERAVRAGLALTEEIGRLTSPGGEFLAARVGIATGLVVVGDLVGTAAAQEQAVIGQTPNLAARLQSLAAPGRIVISAQTRSLVGEIFELIELGPQRLKGFAKPIAAWRVIGIGPAMSRFEAMHEGALTPLIGREHELGLLLDRWELAKSGEGQVVLLSGEAGIGKSRITQSLCKHLTGEPVLQVRYNCSPYHVNSALYPVIDQLERAAGFRPEDTAETKLDSVEALLARTSQNAADVIALIAALLSIPTGPQSPTAKYTPAAQKAKTLEALLGQLVALAQQQPLLLVLEDAHWIDPTTSELIGMAIDRIRGLPVLLLLTFRSEFIPPWTGYAHATSLTLSRLGRRQGSAIIERLTDSKPLPAEVLQEILLKTDGVPLFIEELTKAVLESGLLTDAGDHYVLSGPLPPLAIPATLHGSLMARLDRLAPVREVAQIGAVIGREFSYELICHVAPTDEKSLKDALTQLTASGLIYRTGNPPQATYCFKHALVRDVAYQSLLKVSRQQHHKRIAQVLEERFPRTAEIRPEILAQHYSEAGQIERAIDYWRRAGHLAAERSANVEAATNYERCLQLLARQPESTERYGRELEIEMAVGPVLVAARGFADPSVGGAYARAFELCQRLEDTVSLPVVLRGRQVFHRIRGELGKALELGEQLLSLAKRQEDPGLLIGGYLALGQDLFQMGDLAASRAMAEAGIALFDAGRHRLQNWPGGQPGEQCYLYAAFVLWMLGFPDRALRRADAALALAKKLSNPANLINTLAFVALVHAFRREMQAVRQRAEATMEMSTEQRNPYFLAWGTILCGWALTVQGEGQHVTAQIDRAVADYRATGSQTWLPYFLGLQAETYLRGNRLDDGLGLVAEALELGKKTGERCWEGELNRIKGELLVAVSPDNHVEAENCYSLSIEIARKQQAKSWELRAAASQCRLWCAQRRYREARDLLAPIHAWFAEGFSTPDLAEAKALLGEIDQQRH